MSERRILITGANGFVGQFLIKELLGAGYDAGELFAVTGTDGKAASGPVSTQTCDLRDKRAVDNLIRDLKPTGVVHLAAIALPSQARQDPGSAWLVNVDAVRWLGESLMSYAPAARLVFSGSSECYGASFATAEGPLDEDIALKPMTAYAATKAAADMLLGQMRHDGLDVVRFRAFNHTGPRQSSDYVVASFVEQIVKIGSDQRSATIYVGNIDVKRDFLDVRDVVKAYRLGLEHPLVASSPAVFNLCSGNPVSIRFLLDSLIRASGKHVVVEIDPSKLRKNDIPLTWGDNRRAMNQLGWFPSIPLQMTLSDTLHAAYEAASMQD